MTMQNETRQSFRIERVLVATGLDPKPAVGREFGRSIRPAAPSPRAVVECGSGRLLFAHTFPDAGALIAAMREERPGKP
ncbi:hypothetical protein [Azospirillum lipoferum]|nr:hypothetical protein [Azospirillum lipoferum]